jgi:hypothetical protein
MVKYTSDALIEKVRGYRMTSQETRRQRVSLMLGLRGSDSTLTRERILELRPELRD